MSLNYPKPKLSKPLLVIFKLVIYLGIFWMIYTATSVFLSQPAPLLSFIITMLLIIPNRGKLSNFLQQLIDRGFYRQLYQLKKASYQFELDLNSTLKFEELLERWMDFLNQNFSPLYYAFFLLKKNSFEGINLKETNNSPRVIEFVAESFQNSPFELPIGFIPVAQVWKGYPKYRLLLRNYVKSQSFTYFVPLKGNTQVVGFLLFHQALEDFLRVPEVTDFLLNLFSKTARVLENARIHSEMMRKSLESELFLEIVQKITSTLNLQEVLEGIVDSLSSLVSFDAVMIGLLDEDQKVLKHTVSRGYDPEMLKLISLKVGQGLSGWVIQHQKGINTPDVRKDSRYYPARPKTRSQITVPIISQGKAIGALALESDEIAHFTKEDLELITTFSGLAAIAIRNAQLYEDSQKKQQLESDLLVASKVQQALLPRRVPAIAGLKIDVVNVPSQIVGGDLYDAFRIGEHQQGLAIGDVSGKGAPGAILMAVAYAGFKSLFNEIDPVVTVLARLNNLLVEATSSGYYVTFFYGILDRKSRSFVYCNAGHNPPVLLHSDGSIQFLHEGGAVLGFMANLEYQQAIINVAPGDYLVFYTDGVTEVKNFGGEEFGEQRLIETLRAYRGQTAREMRRGILNAMKKFASGCEFQDDVTLMIVQITDNF